MQRYLRLSDTGIVILERVVPPGRSIDAAALAAELRARVGSTVPFAESTCALFGQFSRQLRRHPAAKAYPELQALAFWTRPAWISQLRGEWDRLVDGPALLVPRGLIFHVPPANVDTIFVYSWALAALTGNINVIRLPSAVTEQIQIIADVLASLLSSQDFTDLSGTVALVRYGHDMATTAALSAAADVRVVWGGDDTVQRIRGAALAPAAIELTFPDRFSLAALDARSVVNLDQAALDRLGEAFFNDVFWFDQLGCSSPRLVVWCGDQPTCVVARHRLYGALVSACQHHGYAVPLSAVLDKLGYAYDAAADGGAVALHRSTNETTVVELSALDAVDRSSPGGGLFQDVRVEQLDHLAGQVARKDQTLSYFGFGRAELAGLATKLNGRGIDRMVPIGQALAFSRYWDGYDLLQAFTRRVDIVGPPPARPGGP
jgi:hypothetical protein